MFAVISVFTSLEGDASRRESGILIECLLVQAEKEVRCAMIQLVVNGAGVQSYRYILIGTFSFSRSIDW